MNELESLLTEVERLKNEQPERINITGMDKISVFRSLTARGKFIAYSYVESLIKEKINEKTKRR